MGFSPVGERSLVKHSLTGSTYELKSVSVNQHDQNKQVLMSEVLTLQKMSKDKNFVAIRDFFEDQDGIYLLTAHMKHGSLRKFVEKSKSA